ncbi:hypothetical protein [Haloferula sp. BvORR071]|uniref:hypothetical protein n=1 Tax=Haloferula sp. BvORR071 TaxID=1396141 RepID=UPI002240EEA1|nr:hypothetical protein [Haloferula sp. BvORR071]
MQSARRVAAALLVLSALVLAAAWRDQGRLAALQAEQAALRERAEQSSFRQEAVGLALPAKLALRPDPEAEGRRVAASFIAHVREMEALQDAALNRPDKALREQMISRLDEVVRLDGQQLRILIIEVLASGEIDTRQREDLIAYVFPKLLTKDPRAAFGLLWEKPDLDAMSTLGKPMRRVWLSYAMSQWAEQEPQAALRWLREHSPGPDAGVENLPDFTRSVIYGTSRSNPRLAMELAREYGLDSTEMVTSMLQEHGYTRTPEQRTEALILLREWTATTTEPAEARWKPVTNMMRALAFGTAREGYEPTMAWIEAQNFSAQELVTIAEDGFGPDGYYRVRDEDRGRWSEWLAKVLPPDKARKPIQEVFNGWLGDDPEAANRWLSATPESPARSVAMGVLVERTIYTNPEEAQRLVFALPEGADRAELLVKLYRNWPGGSEEARAAAEKMAEVYGVGR